MPYIGMSELVIFTDVNEVRPEQSSITDSGTACTPLSETRCGTESLNAKSIDGLEPMYQNPCATDARRVARKHPHSEGGCNITPLIPEVTFLERRQGLKNYVQLMRVQWHAVHVVMSSS